MLVASIGVRCGLAMGCVAVGRFRSFELGPFDGLLLIFLFQVRQIVIMMRSVGTLEDNIQQQHLP